MLFITDSEVERTVSRLRNRIIAKRYYEEGYVTEIYIEKIYGGYSIEGEVVINNYHYYPLVRVNDSNKIIYTNCDCIYADEYTSCAHIGALLLKVQELSPEVFPYRYQLDKEAYYKEKRDKISSYFEQLHQRIEEEKKTRRINTTTDFYNDTIKNMMNTFQIESHEPVHLVIYLEDKGYYGQSLRFKIGRERLYFIKNIIRFLEDLSSHQHKKYGKYFSWSHQQEELTEESLKVLEFIKRYHDDYGDNIYINDFNIDSLIDLCKELPKEYVQNITFKPLRSDIHLFIKKKDDVYELASSKVHEDMGEKYLYQFEGTTLYYQSFDPHNVTLKLLRTIEDEEKLLIKEELFNDFQDLILQPIMNYVTIDGLEKEETEKEIIIYADINDNDQVSLQVYLQYEELENVLQSDKGQSLVCKQVLYLINDYKDYNDKEYIYMDLSDDRTIEFVQNGLPFLRQFSTVYISEAIKKIGKKTSMKVDVGLRISKQLLEMDIDSIDIPKEELAEVLRSYRRKKKFYRLKSGNMISLNDESLEELSSMMDKYQISEKDIDNGVIRMDMAHAYALEQDEFASLSISRSEEFESVIHQLKDYKQSYHPLKPHYEKYLKDYQKEGYQWLQTMNELHLGGILADDMGLGKTLQMCTLLDHVDEHFSIVICPSSLIYNWIEELEKYQSSLKPIAITGPLSKRKELIKSIKDYDMVITSYDYIRRDIDYYSDYLFDYCILDEAQYIKNQRTKNAMSVKKINAKHRFALTGTPIENSLAELWSIFDFLNKGYLFSYNYFKKNYESPIIKEQDESKQQELRKLVAPFILRRTKQEVLTELPEKIEKTIKIRFNEEEKRLYYANLAHVNHQLKGLDESKDKIQILAMLTRLRQICIEPRMIYDTMTNISSKMIGALDIIDNYYSNHKKVLLFSSFATLLHFMEEELKKRHIKYHIITGDVSKEKRQEEVQAFQNDNSTVFLISLRAGGTGLNLTAAEAVIHIDPWWNMSAQSQATDRAHRIGQTNKVFVYSLIMKDSIEEKIQLLQQEKQQLADTFVEGHDSIHTMTNEELLSLFQMEGE